MSEANKTGRILAINGPILTIELPGVRNGEQVRIGELGLAGEVIALQGRQAIVQCYESTDGVRPGEEVRALGHPLSVELGPGLMGEIFDGVQRPLTSIFRETGDNIPRGFNPPPLNRERRWHFQPKEDGVELGSQVQPGTLLGLVQETETIEHRILLPPDLSGELLELAPEGDYTLNQSIGRLRDRHGKVHKLHLYHRWPVRKPRPYRAARHCGRTADHRTTHPGYLLPAAQRRQGGGSRSVRRRQDHGAAADRALVQRRHRHLRRLRRARQRTGRRARDLPRAAGPLHRPQADGAHPAGGQHLQHAGGGARGVDLRRHDHGRVLPRSGL